MDQVYKSEQDRINNQTAKIHEDVLRIIERQQVEINVLKHESKVQGYLFGGALVVIGIMVCLMIMATFPVS